MPTGSEHVEDMCRGETGYEPDIQDGYLMFDDGTVRKVRWIAPDTDKPIEKTDEVQDDVKDGK